MVISPSPIPNAKTPPITTLLNRSTHHKSAKGSLPPCPQISWTPKSMNKLHLNEKAMTVADTGFSMRVCQPSSGVPTNNFVKCFEQPPPPLHDIERFWLEVTGVPWQPPGHIHFVKKNYSDTTLYHNEIRNSNRVKALSLLVYIFIQFFFQKTFRLEQFCILQKESPHKIEIRLCQQVCQLLIFSNASEVYLHFRILCHCDVF